MVGLIKLSGVDGMPYWINPLSITLFTPNTEELCKRLTGSILPFSEKSSIVIVNGLPLQVRDTPSEIIGSIQRLRDQQENRYKQLKKKLEREDWQDDEDDFDPEDM